MLALGRWSQLFAKQWAVSGLTMPVIAGGTHTDEHVLPQLGDETVGVISAHHYSAALDTPANRRFRAAFEKKYNRSPSFYSENCYTGARVVAEAAKAVDGKVEDRPAFMNALRHVEIADAPRGPVKMDPYGNPTQNIYIRKVERVGGKLQNTVIYTYPNVSQFWKYNPEEFLKQPVYWREFPHPRCRAGRRTSRSTGCRGGGATPACPSRRCGRLPGRRRDRPGAPWPAGER